MYEFSLEEPVEDMDEADLRSTLDAFMDQHAENVEEYEALAKERDEFSEKAESLEADVSEYAETAEALQAKFAEVVADESPLFDADEVAERFSLDELISKADALGAFSLATETDEGADDDADEGEGPTFADKPERAPVPSDDDKSAFREQAESDLRAVLGDY
ncbi:hypothetical protein HRTV-25_gp14 [Halorubrum tailed virus 25]|uniref:Uncharacterized protein n=1 Tax=Halorubrum tailed virus 25 TaxID=2878006 RepID=A0AAE8XY40_9CAUD|nr:hypothetical protein M1M37_gp014 [Halorubrum tailed virus 25]UBF22595.1 hypothetical protein HRTV-25_gp14 [Halorubrum tailed virus 25]